MVIISDIVSEVFLESRVFPIMGDEVIICKNKL